MASTPASHELVPIDEVCRRFALASSTLRYYERRGLVTAASKRAGKRWYAPDDVRRIGAIRFWQSRGRLSLDDIDELLADSPGASWSTVIARHLGSIEDQIADLLEARAVLEHIVEHHPDGRPDGCPFYEELISTQSR